ncbi:uncharacterized protein LOC134813346 [Bolinopsis microptera]|uniref:uncharacterized protein LOC134813346 n=1 Tax=Bolinopsis microptera TaxID=2820187 RepID=UPI003079D10A
MKRQRNSMQMQKIPIILAIMLSMTGRSVKAENVKRDIVNLMEKIDEQCNGNEGCLKNMYKRLEENIGSYNKIYPGLPYGDADQNTAVDTESFGQTNEENMLMLDHVKDESNEQLEHELDHLKDMFNRIHTNAGAELNSPFGTGTQMESEDDWGGLGSSNSIPENKIRVLTGMDVNLSDVRAMDKEDRLNWKQEMRGKLQEAKGERKVERDELKRQREAIKDSKHELEYYQKDMLLELEEEIAELNEEKEELLKEKEEILQEIENRDKNEEPTEPPF